MRLADVLIQAIGRTRLCGISIFCPPPRQGQRATHLELPQISITSMMFRVDTLYVCTLPTRLTLNKERSEQVTFYFYFGSRHPKPWCLMYLAHIEYVNKALVAIIAILLISALRYTLWQLLDRDKFAFNYYTVIVGGLILRSLSFEFWPHENIWGNSGEYIYSRDMGFRVHKLALVMRGQ